MNRLILFTSILLSAQSGHCQDTLKTNKHQVGISFYQPHNLGEPQGAGLIPPEFVVIYDGSNLSGSRYGLGLDYQYQLNKKDFCFLKVGMTQNNRTDELEQEYYNEFGVYKYNVELDLDVKRTQLNLSLGYGRSIRFTERFSMDLGFSIVGIMDLKNQIRYDLNEKVIFEDSVYRTYETSYSYHQDYARWFHIGISPLIRPVISINDKLSIAAEAQLMGLFSFSTKNGSFVRNYSFKDYDINYEYYNYDESVDLDTEFKATFFSLSKIAPTLRVAYKF